MKNLFFRSLLLLSCLIAAQNLHAQLTPIIPTDSGCFSMEIEKVSSDDSTECVQITITVSGLEPGETIYITDGNRSIGFSGTHSFIWCYERPLDMAIELLIECFIQTNSGDRCRDGCTISIDPRQ